MRTITELAVEQLVAYNAADLDAFCACYHPEVQVLQGSEVVCGGIEAFRALYADKFARGGFGGVVPRRVERGEVCIEEEHYWVDWPQGRIDGVILVRWTRREGLIGEVAFSSLASLIETVRDALLEGARVTVAGLGMFTPCTRAKTGCRTVMFRPRPGSGSPEVEALKDFLSEEDRLELVGLGTLKADDHRGGRRLRFHASEAFMALLTEAVWPE